MMAFANVGSAAASQTWVKWHHVDQGVKHDQTWTQCMPNDSINGHNGHTGDYLVSGPYSDNRCQHLIVPPTPTSTNTPTTVPPTATNTLAPTATPVPPTFTPVPTEVDDECEDGGSSRSFLSFIFGGKKDGENGDNEGEDCATETPEPTKTLEPTATNTPTTVPPTETLEPTATNTPVIECGGENYPCPVTETVVPTNTPVIVETPGGIWVPTCEEMSKMSPNEFVRWTNRWVNLKDANGLSCDQRGFHTGSGSSPVSFLLFVVAGLFALLGAGSLLFGKKQA